MKITDKMRLDWLDQVQPCMAFDPLHLRWKVEAEATWKIRWGDTTRKAIDAAIRAARRRKPHAR